jgi:hypothetical protein
MDKENMSGCDHNLIITTASIPLKLHQEREREGGIEGGGVQEGQGQGQEIEGQGQWSLSDASGSGDASVFTGSDLGSDSEESGGESRIVPLQVHWFQWRDVYLRRMMSKLSGSSCNNATPAPRSLSDLACMTRAFNQWHRGSTHGVTSAEGGTSIDL